MRCPFLKETRVKYCDKSAVRKMIRIPGNVAQETCTSPEYSRCAVYQQHADGSAATECPYLRESVAQYCAAAPLTRLIPYSESVLSRCGSAAHRYCDVYLTAVRPPAPRHQDIAAPEGLYYSANHMWLATAGDGSCHLGIDGFLARVLGGVERITFLTQQGIRRASTVLTARGVDLEAVFPNPVLLTAANLYLRANPGKLCADPYGAGWLFEGAQLPGQPAVTSGLKRGDSVAPWMRQEIDRMSAFLDDCRISQRGHPLARDGGVFSAEVLACLTRDEILRLFHEFFWGSRI
jgi:glycine cleavage system H lipoate-binding protein